MKYTGRLGHPEYVVATHDLFYTTCGMSLMMTTTQNCGQLASVAKGQLTLECHVISL